MSETKAGYDGKGNFVGIAYNRQPGEVYTTPESMHSGERGEGRFKVTGARVAEQGSLKGPKPVTWVTPKLKEKQEAERRKEHSNANTPQHQKRHVIKLKKEIEEIKEIHKLRDDIIQEEFLRDETSNYLLLKEKIKKQIENKMLEIRHKNNAAVYGFDNVEDYLTKLRSIKEDPEKWKNSVYFHFGSEYPPVVVLSDDEKKTIHVHLLLKDYLGSDSNPRYATFKGILSKQGINIDDICVNCDKIAEYGLENDLKPKHCFDHKLDDEVERVNPLKNKIRDALEANAVALPHQPSSGETKSAGSPRAKQFPKLPSQARYQEQFEDEFDKLVEGGVPVAEDEGGKTSTFEVEEGGRRRTRRKRRRKRRTRKVRKKGTKKKTRRRRTRRTRRRKTKRKR